MNKKILLFITFICLSLSLFAFDFGGFIENNSSVDGSAFALDKLALSQNDKVGLWIRTPLNDTVSFTSEGYYKFSLNSPLDPFSSDNITHEVNLNLFKLEMLLPLSSSSSLELDLGRFYVSDSSFQVYAGEADGLLVNLSFPAVGLSLYGGYTGSLNAKTASFFKAQSSYDSKAIYPLASKYLLTSWNVSVPNFVSGHSFNAEYFGTFDLNSYDNSESKVNRFYGSISANGPLVPRLYYNFVTTYNFNLSTEKTMGLLSEVNLVYYANFLNSSLMADFLLITPDFLPTTMNSAGLNGSYPYQNLMKATVSGTILPISNLFLSLTGDAIFVFEDKVPSFDAIQWQGYIQYQVVSDVQIALSVGQLFPMGNNGDSYMTGSLKVLLSF